MFKSSWIYFAIFFATLFFAQFLNYRFHHPTVSYQQLTTIKPSSQFLQPNPCVFNIIGGIPNSPPPDGNIQVNFYCPGGLASRNYLRLGAINPPTIHNALSVLSAVNNFNLPPNLKIVVSGSPTTDLNQALKIDDVVEITYE